MGESKPDTPHQIPLDANIKYVCGFSASIRIRVDVARATFHVDSMTLQLTTKKRISVVFFNLAGTVP